MTTHILLFSKNTWSHWNWTKIPKVPQIYILKKNWKFDWKSYIVVVLWELRTVVNLYLVMEKV
jgi:hypothetical protein